MASRALARRPAEAPRREETNRTALKAVRPAPKESQRAASRARLWRAFVIFVICFAVLAAGRVAMSFAVVQKTVATDAIAREERQISAENAQLAEKLAQLGSTVRIRSIAQTRLGMIQAQDPQYLTVAGSSAAESSARP
jgi:cell division protein FtsL